MSDIRLVNITDTFIADVQQRPQPLHYLFAQLGGDWNIERQHMSAQIATLIFWRDVERWVAPLGRYAMFLIFAPLFALSYSNMGGTSIVFVLLPIGMILSIIGAVLMWFQSSYATQYKLRVLKEGFVVLVGDVLIENLPQHRLLLQEQVRLQKLVVHVQQQKEKLQTLHTKLIEKSQALQENSNDLIHALRNEKVQLDTVFHTTQQLLYDVGSQLKQFDEQRKIIFQRAELEYIRSQARALTREDQIRFSLQALTELQIDALSIQTQINDVEHELGKQGIRYELDNKYSV